MSNSDILVGVDGTPASDAALRWALHHAALTQQRVTAVHAWQLPLDPGPGGLYLPSIDDAGMAAQAQVLLDEAIDRTQALFGRDWVPPDVRPVVTAGSAAQVLETMARSASMLVLGQRTDTRLARAVFGSAVSGALHHVACPVVVVPATAEPTPDSGRVVVGVAEGQASGGALAWAAATAAASRHPLVILYVRPPMAGGEGDWPDADALDDVALKQLHELTDTVTHDLSVPVVTDVVVGDAGPELVRYVTPDDVLVVGSRGRGQLAGWFLGSTSSHVVREAPCPVAVVREPAAAD
jgi:nucleotide-binding universal stress UspA family protein